MEKRVVIYRTSTGNEPYTEYVESLRDRASAAKIRARVRRAGLGNLGDHRTSGQGVIELRIHDGPGYRIYIGLYGQELIVLLGAGDKDSQDKDIRRAREYWEDFKRTL